MPKKYECNQRKLNRVKNNMKVTWNVLNTILNKENAKVNRIKVNDIEIENDLDVANEFSKFFVNSIIELNEELPSHTYENEIVLRNNPVFNFHGVTISEIKSCLKELKDNTDEFLIKPNVLLDAVFVIGLLLAEIINQLFNSGISPASLKASTIIPIQKKMSLSTFLIIDQLTCSHLLKG